MTRKRDDIASSLTKKGFRKGDGDHEFYIYWNQNGKKTMRRTKLSRGTKYKSIGDDLLGKMAKQVGLSKKSFLELVDCTLDQAGYEKEVFRI